MSQAPAAAPLLIESAEYRDFRERFARRQLTACDGSRWKLFDTGRKPSGLRGWANGTEETSTLVCVPGTSGTGASFFLQILALEKEGYRVVAIECYRAWTHKAWADGLDLLLDDIGISRCHFYGVSLGGFLLQVFAFRHPEKVISLALTNAFNDTALFARNAPCVRGLRYMPEFYLKKYGK